MTVDHKPNLDKEKKRIEAKGGRVVFDGFYNHRVFAAKGMYPGLNMSWAFGDKIAHDEAGLTAEPDVYEFDHKTESPDKEVLLVLCTDGVWEFIESEDKQQEVLKIWGAKGKGFSTDNVSANWDVALKKLTKESYDRWMKD